MKQNWNLKKMLAMTGILTITVPTSLSLISHQENQSNLKSYFAQQNNYTNVTDENIASEINRTSYSYIKEIAVKSTVTHLKALINAEFVKSQLINELRTEFNDNLFSLNKITDDSNQEILDSDLAVTNIINGKFNYNYGTIKEQTAKLIIIVKVEDQQIVNEINSIFYNNEVNIGATVADLKDAITPEFIKNELTEEMKNNFSQYLFSLNKITNEQGIEITNDDLKNKSTIYAKIHYDYNDIKNQETNLLINHKDNRNLLNDIFKDFKFKEIRGTEGFLDANDLNIITNQIEKYLGKSLNAANLILEKQQATSIVLKAKPESKYYQGKVKLSWNLKLFEITGQGLASSTDINVREGIKLFIYLDHKDNLVKAFDYASSKNSRTTIGWYFSFFRTHNLQFTNNKGFKKSFNIYSWNLTSNVAASFGRFDFGNGIKVQLNGLMPPYYIGVFKKDNMIWDDARNKTYFIDYLGNIN